MREAQPDINTPKELAERLAVVTRHTCDLLREAYEVEDEHGDLHALMGAFKQTLIPDLNWRQGLR